MDTTIQAFSYINGMCSALYFIVCLLCGLQLCYGVLYPKQSNNSIISRHVGIIFLMMSASAVCYVLSALFVGLETLLIVGSSIDLMMFSIIASVGYMLWTNKTPSYPVFFAISVPFIILVILNIFGKEIHNCIPDIASAIMLSFFIYFELKLRKHEQLFEELYSDPEAHQSKWRWSLIIFLLGWFTMRRTFLAVDLIVWYDAAIFLFMTILVLFVFVKVNKFGTPVHSEIMMQLLQEDSCCIDTVQNATTSIRTGFLNLLEDKKIFLMPDLKVEDVVKDLGTNTKYFSRMLHNMNTTFCRIVNDYRIEYAKQLLNSSDEKIEQVAKSCGFNSYQSFVRTFVRVTGITPSEWRKE